MNGEHKLGPQHLKRRAVVYLRQSSEAQVRHNVESRDMQYALAERARELGFREVEIIDEDLGSSASVGARERRGFERLLGLVALADVGLLLGREVSRLLRTDKDFCRLLEVCQVFDTIVGDEHSLYDVNTMDDQLVLGIKGTLSVVEMKVLGQRLVAGARNKARRGALYTLLPPGYVLDGARQAVKDPDLRVQEAVALVFAKFRESGSVRQTLKWFRDEEVDLPVNKARGGKFRVVFQPPTRSLVDDILHNPFYAGAYAYGRRPLLPVWENGMLRKRQGAAVPLEKLPVLLRDHHEGYIDWTMFEDNLHVMRENFVRGESDAAIGAARSGQGLLAGLLRCGRCGRKLHVRYTGRSGTKARYLCSGSFAGGGTYCLGFGGTTLDARVGKEVVRAISPWAIEASLEAAAQACAQDDARRAAACREVEQREYEARRAFEQYDQVDPRNRLVATELERRWNEGLQELERARASLARVERDRPLLSEEQRRKVVEMGTRFGDEVWNNPACPVVLKKRVLRTVIEEVVVQDADEERMRFVIHWKGGTHTAFEMAKLSRGAACRTAGEDLEVIRRMAPRYGDDDIAAVLNRLGRSTGKGKRWSRESVKSARNREGISGRARTVRDPEVLSLQAAMRLLGVSDATILRLGEAGLVSMQQVVECGPWEIRRADLESEAVRSIVGELKRTGRLKLRGDTAPGQEKLYE